jgi:murein DD-endopeptidase MepM/ murein hydrolase activator NlpD
MSWRDIMRRVLPPIGDLSPEITSAYGTTKGRKPPASIPHGGVDFNYPIGQTGINLKHPALRSPVAGIVTTNPGEGTFGRIAIRDANGLSHEILHTDTQYVKRGELVGVGQPIGSMGNTGTKDQHVHYQLKILLAALSTQRTSGIDCGQRRAIRVSRVTFANTSIIF